MKNSTSNSKSTFDKIQQVLAKSGASKIMFDYAPDGSGQLEAITFAIRIDGQEVGFRLPAMKDNVFQILYGSIKSFPPKHKLHESQRQSYMDQAYKTAWANIRDWIDAQMALVQTRQVELVQVFLPYMLTKDGSTVYQKISKNPGLFLGEGGN